MSRQDTVGGGVAKLTPAMETFLIELVSWSGIASIENLRFKDAAARQSCKRKGFVTFDGPGGYWRITDAGRAALKTAGGRE